MTRQEWLDLLVKLQRDQETRDVTGERALRRLLAELVVHLDHCPRDVAIAYRQASEATLTFVGEERRLHLAEGRIAWAKAASDVDLAVEIGGQLRAIDAELADRPYFAQPPSGPNSYLCRDAGVYVIPRRDGKTIDERTGPGRGFGRRGTPHHRVLPRIVADAFTVELVWDPRLSGGRVAGQTRRLGAALLPGMALGPEPEPNVPWVAATCSCADDPAVIERQINGCYDDDALAVVYPELSMPEARRDALSKALDERSRRCEPDRGPALVAAGSWHDDEGGEVRNVMRVFDKTGVERLRYAKSSAYFRDDVTEGIVIDRSIPVLVNTDFLATFAICLDFCERELAPPYDRLDVDLTLVASLGNAKTMKGHEANAGDVASKTGGRTFVVQQNDSGETPLGFVFPPCGADETAENREWSTRRISLN